MYYTHAVEFQHSNHLHWMCLFLVDNSISPEMFQNHMVIALIDSQWQIEVDSE